MSAVLTALRWSLLENCEAEEPLVKMCKVQKNHLRSPDGVPLELGPSWEGAPEMPSLLFGLPFKLRGCEPVSTTSSVLGVMSTGCALITLFDPDLPLLELLSAPCKTQRKHLQAKQFCITPLSFSMP